MRPITRDSIPHLVSCFFYNFRAFLHSFISRLLAFWWRIEVGAGCQFHGIPMFRRLPGSEIIIGKMCRFNSAPWSNFMGLNHKCILTTLDEQAVIKIGERCGFSGSVIAAAESVLIGDDVLVGANTVISDTDWHSVDYNRRATGEMGASSPIVIEDFVWLGANVVVLKGVTIGKASVISANSVVTKSIPANVIAGGVPAEIIKNLV
ncbi:MAG: acyltransferase [Clostridiales bacterium]|nr:acyltransferase [Clostridiales bacterium]